MAKTTTTELTTCHSTHHTLLSMEKTTPKYYHELSLEDMLKQHDYTYMYSDDHRWYEQGRIQRETINAKIDELGGWCDEFVKLHNKYCPKPMQISEEWLENYLLKQ